MPRITSIDQANQILADYVLLSKKTTGQNITLERMYPLLELVGNPHKRLKIIHVAGTSGKTSTAYFISGLLQQTGKKIGLTVSPHVDSVAERVQINGRPLEEARFCDYLSQFLELITSVQPTYFELLVAFAFWVFGRERVDYAVVEVGMGGLHDGTNAANAADKICVITDIGLDHTNILGTTLPEIAAQKAGIIHEHNVVFTYHQSDEIMKVIKKTCTRFHAQLCEISLENEVLPPELPLFQQRNWFLAKNVAEYVIQRDDLAPLTQEQLEVSASTYIPARMEVIHYHGKVVVMDGAHNPQKMSALVGSLQARFPNQKFCVLIGMLSGKDLHETLKVLLPVASQVLATEFQAEQDMPRASITARDIVKTAQQQGYQNITISKDPKEALRELVKDSSSPILVAGSFFLLNHIRPLIFKE